MEIKNQPKQTHYVDYDIEGDPIVVTRASVVGIVRIASDENTQVNSDDQFLLYVPDIPKLIKLLQAAYEQKGASNA